ncbi:methyltransferase domain-containing protein [Thermosulfurimonas marina]|uniref:Methyltransferase domain-containing protein n=1 Tax=Thermosulfurimonas marina TaxID=2047767 RepID=A0A6H1WS76_9BACT|nr:50S ribosomal protein L11 methyltransferase [Thermosulfurimonas marina]QJA06009.1 methyltransferase domain-containing protein [Thermosulfurimonas marina]
MPYLRVKIRTRDPQEVLARLSAGGEAPLASHFLDTEGLLILVYPGEGLHERLRRLARLLPQADFEETELAEEADLQEKTFQVGPLTFRLTLSPGPVPPGEISLRANLSFGSGRHATTLLCLKALVRLAQELPLGRVFDLGCGSGILSLAAAHLGAERVLAADIDPRAVREARYNVALNALGERILVIRGSLSAARPASFDLVLANLTIGTILALAPEIPRLLRPGGLAILSGFGPSQKGELLARLPQARVYFSENLEGWQALVLGF